MIRYGKGMRDCCDSPAQRNQAHIKGCPMTAPTPGAVLDAEGWSAFEDDLSDAIQDSIDMDWNSRDGAKAVVRWLNENAAPPAQTERGA